MLHGNYSRKTKKNGIIFSFPWISIADTQLPHRRGRNNSRNISIFLKPTEGLSIKLEMKQQIPIGFSMPGGYWAAVGIYCALYALHPTLTISEDTALLEKSCTPNFRVSVHIGHASRGSLCTELSLCRLAYNLVTKGGIELVREKLLEEFPALCFSPWTAFVPWSAFADA